MEAVYKKTQTGWIIILSFIPVFLFFACIFYYQEILDKPLGGKPAPSYAFLGFLLLFLIPLALFYSLTVTAFPTYLEMKFGIGLIHKKFHYKDIRSCSVQKSHWYYGWGIRKIPRGWLYNVSGLMSVQLEMKNGKMYRIGTDEPEKLMEFIMSRIGLFGNQ